jgi:hypothetical protein
MVKMSPDELSHPNHERLVLTVRCNLGFEDQGDGQQLDSAPAATLAFWILVHRRPMSALGQKRTFLEFCAISALPPEAVIG